MCAGPIAISRCESRSARLGFSPLAIFGDSRPRYSTPHQRLHHILSTVTSVAELFSQMPLNKINPPGRVDQV
jgi:hypothetical protein